MKKGDVLVAIDPCVMRLTDRATLTVGKEYTVIKVDDDDRVFIIDDDGDSHLFPIKRISKYFMEKVQTKLKQP